MATLSKEDTSYVLWRDVILSQVSGASPLAVNHAIKLAIRNFLLRAPVWKELFFVKVTANKSYSNVISSKYSNVLSTVADADLGYLLQAWFKGAPLRTAFATPATANVSSSPTISAVRFAPPNKLEFLNIPTEASTTDLECEFSLVPDRDSVIVPEVLSTHYFDEITSGALASLYIQPDKPYTNGELAKVYRFKFIQAQNLARSNVLKGYSTIDTGFKFNPAYM